MSTRTDSPGPKAAAPAAAGEPPAPILALDVPDAEQALALVGRVPAAQWVKVGLQLFTAEGPDVVRRLRARGLRVFLDLKLHDIPNTVAHAVRSAAGLGVELLTVHAGGGAAMLRAAREAAGARGQGPRLFAVTVLTSLDAAALGEAWGRPVDDVEMEAVRLARLAAGAELDGVVCSVHEARAIRAIRAATGSELALLTPGIRLPGGERHDQARVATPAEAARRGAAFLVVGRAVTAAPDPAAAWDAVLQDARAGAASAGSES